VSTLPMRINLTLVFLILVVHALKEQNVEPLCSVIKFCSSRQTPHEVNCAPLLGLLIIILSQAKAELYLG